MAKHAHRILFIDRRLWKCHLSGCNWFIYRGQEHILIGREVVCWNCGDTFNMTQEEIDNAHKDEMPKCTDCRRGYGTPDIDSPATHSVDIDAFESYAITKRELIKAGVNSVNELSPTRRMMIEANTGVKLMENFTIKTDGDDEVEIIEPITTDTDVQSPMTDHVPSCPAYFDPSSKCTCGYM